MQARYSRSAELFQRAQHVMPGGVNSPVRAFAAVGGQPVFVAAGRGAWLEDVDGHRYVDCVGSWGPLILGHAHPAVLQAIVEAASRGCTYGATTAAEIDIAETISAAVPSIEMVRLTSSGTEAVMGALRLARGFTGRDLVVKFDGAYHGGADYLLVRAGSGAATLGVPDSRGVPAAIAGTTLVLPYNDEAALRTLLAQRGEEIAAVIVEPVAGNMGCVPPDAGWLAALRESTERAGSLLVFDEVMTGFRLAYGGAQQLYGIRPDLTCLGKVIGGGLPMGAYGGRRDIMRQVAPTGPVYQAGTLSGNPLAVAAGLATLAILREDGVYAQLEARSAAVAQAIEQAGAACTRPWCLQRVGSMLTVFFDEGPVRSWGEADRCDRQAFGRWHQALLAHGVYWPPSQFEAAFLSLAHEEAALACLHEAVAAAFAAC